jgi:hypothetical protein
VDAKKVLLSPARINLLGLNWWPDFGVLARLAVFDGDDVDLTATLARIESEIGSTEQAMSGARNFARTWNAPLGDATVLEGEWENLKEAASHVRLIISVAERRDR